MPSQLLLLVRVQCLCVYVCDGDGGEGRSRRLMVIACGGVSDGKCVGEEAGELEVGVKGGQ